MNDVSEEVLARMKGEKLPQPDGTAFDETQGDPYFGEDPSCIAADVISVLMTIWPGRYWRLYERREDEVLDRLSGRPAKVEQ